MDARLFDDASVPSRLDWAASLLEGATLDTETDLVDEPVFELTLFVDEPVFELTPFVEEPVFELTLFVGVLLFGPMLFVEELPFEPTLFVDLAFTRKQSSSATSLDPRLRVENASIHPTRSRRRDRNHRSLTSLSGWREPPILA